MTIEDQPNVIREVVKLANLNVGDTVEVNGIFQTVNKGHVKYDPFMGYTYKGATYKRGITKITFITFFQGRVKNV
jgi:hypothetical protein